MHDGAGHYGVLDRLLMQLLRRTSQPPRWMERLALRRAVSRAYRHIEAHYAHYTQSLFDEHFLTHQAMPLLEGLLRPDKRPTGVDLVGAWSAQLGLSDAIDLGYRHEELLPVAEALLRVLDTELRCYLPISRVDSDAAQSASLFAEVLREDSNRELDWLWLAGTRSCPHERAYCLERALFINPSSQQTHRELEALKLQLRPQQAASAMTIQEAA